MGSKNCGHRSANSTVNVWDSDVYDESERFGRFRELCSQTFLPVRTEDVSNSGFHARMESRSVNSGWVGRCTTSPVEAFRTIRDIDNSSMECVYLTLVRSGELVTEQGQISRHFGKNEVSIGTSMKPAVTRLLSKIETLTVVLHTNELLSRIPNCDAFIAGLPWAGTPIGPLASCLNFIGACLFDAPQAELNAMIDSAMCMLPVAVGASHRNSRSGLDLSNSTLKNIVRFVNSNLSNPTLRRYLCRYESSRRAFLPVVWIKANEAAVAKEFAVRFGRSNRISACERLTLGVAQPRMRCGQLRTGSCRSGGNHGLMMPWMTVDGMGIVRELSSGVEDS